MFGASTIADHDSSQQPHVPGQFPRWHAPTVTSVLLTFTILLLIGALAYLPYLTRLGFYQDDWRNIGELIANGELSRGGARPVNVLVFELGWSLFGLNIQAYLLTAVLLHVIAAMVYWWLLYTLLGEYRQLATPIAALFLVYPSVYSRTWFTLWPAGLHVALVLGGALAYVRYVRHRDIFAWLLSMLLLGATLFWYELPFALIALLPLLAVKQMWQSSWLRRMLLLGPTFVAGLFLMWWLLTPRSQEYAPSGMVFSVSDLLIRLAGSYWAILPVAWIEPIRFLGPTVLPRWQAITVFAGVLLAATVIAALFALRPRSGDWDADNSDDAYGLWPKTWLSATVIGFLVIGLGVLPALPLAPIVVEILGSRFTLFAALGASALIVLIVYGAALLLTRRHSLAMRATYVLSSTLVLLAIGFQQGAQRTLADAWERQKCAWHSMLAQAPSFQNGTHVHLIDVPAPTGIWGVAPFQHLVPEFDTPLKLLYADPTLQGTYAHQGNVALWAEGEFRLAPDGVRQDNTGLLIPYEQSVIFRYRADDSLELLAEVAPEQTVSSSFHTTGAERIMSTSAQSPYLMLIAPQADCVHSQHR